MKVRILPSVSNPPIQLFFCSKEIRSVWYTVAIRLVVNPIGLKTQVNYVALIVKCRNGAMYVTYLGSSSSRSKLTADVPNHMKYTSQGSGNSYIPAGFVTFFLSSYL